MVVHIVNHEHITKEVVASTLSIKLMTWATILNYPCGSTILTLGVYNLPYCDHYYTLHIPFHAREAYAPAYRKKGMQRVSMQS